MFDASVWIQLGVISIYGASLDADSHCHHAIQIIWPESHSVCRINGGNINGPVIIDSNIEHQLQMSGGWVLLVEPKSLLGETLVSRLAGKAYRSFELAPFSSENKPSKKNDLALLLLPLFKALSLSQHSFTVNASQVKDQRIGQLIAKLDFCLQGDCLKPASWRASDVASQLALSESRFLHLFKDELGISWRPYLLWRRMICALQAMVIGDSATNAAYKSGFSDSAHLSRTFKKTFGMTIRQAQALFSKT